MKAPWKKSYLGFEYEHQCRVHHRENHFTGLDPLLSVYLFIFGNMLVVIGILILASQIFGGRGSLSLFFGCLTCVVGVGAITCAISYADFTGAVRKLYRFFPKYDGTEISRWSWKELQSATRFTLHEKIKVWSALNQISSTKHPLSQAAEDAEEMRREIRADYTALAQLGIMPRSESPEGCRLLTDMTFGKQSV